ncbi:biotin transporter BioY [Serinicoccus kebangsaanensis]|uniref:biotin transporter BioY n=1 Tax=Serinicoccus kebangsaanensis TaxID=2602069 RepID=UPI00124EC763|nr:biotin transporter BioY [Serinicoccus kebangsaanensis]
MSTAAATPSRVAPVLADRLVPRRGVLTDVGLVAGGVVVVSLLALVQFRIGPVPITGQTLGVILVGSALGMRRGAAALTTYLLAGLAGAPVFAGGGGPAYVMQPSFGYIIGFVAAAAIAGWAAERAWDRHVGLAMVGFLLATAAPFVVGVPWLAAVLQTADPATVAAAGIIPFIVPGVIKAGIAAAVFPLVWALVRRLEADRR